MNHSGMLTRVAGAGLALALLSLAAVTLWSYGSTPTDENLFTDPPSFIHVSAPLAGRPAGPVDPAAAAAGTPPEVSLEPGDFVVAVGGAPVRTVEAFRAALAERRGIVQATARRARGGVVTLDVDAEALGRLPVRDVSGTALVIDVVPGGASDRAGMRVGDLILRINEQRFRDMYEADRLMRTAPLGRATSYEILRANQPLTLHVRLAAFGLRLSLLVCTFAGLAWMLFGTFLLLARPAIPAARYLGLAFLLLGFTLSVVLLGRPHGLSRVRDVAVVACGFLGLACFLDACLYFPRERASLLARRWVRPGGYALAVASAIGALAAGGSVAVLAPLVAINLAYHGLVRWLGRRDRTPEIRRVTRALRWASAVAAGAALLAAAAQLARPPLVEPGYAGLALVLVPAAHLYTIGRYGLLDLRLRVRRHVQYWVVSVLWGLVPLGALAWVLVALSHSRVPMPDVRLTGSAVEVLRSPLGAAQQALAERLVLMAAAVAAAFGLRAVWHRGHAWLASRFYQASHDYRRAARAVSTLVSERPDLEALASGFVDTVARLLQVKRAGLVLAHGERAFAGGRGHGFAPHEWARLASAAGDILEGVRKARGEVNAEYVFPRLRRLLAAADVQYLFAIRLHDRPVGAVLLGEKLAEDAFRDDDFEFLGALAAQVAPAVENAFLYQELAAQERLRHELEIARRIQMESLPQRTPSVEGLEVAGLSVPAFEVGGDYFDYLDGVPGRLTVVVGDVSGKGTSAALYMSRLQGILRSLHGFALTPHELFVRTNALLCEDLERRWFVTALGGFFDAARRELVVARAGHLPLYYYESAAGRVHRVLPRGLGFGLSPRPLFAQELEEQLVRYRPGDVFLFITDGITECQDEGGHEFGEERVMAVLEQHASGSAVDIRDRLMAAVQAFSTAADRFDDQTVVVVKATASSGGA